MKSLSRRFFTFAILAVMIVAMAPLAVHADKQDGVMYLAYTWNASEKKVESHWETTTDYQLVSSLKDVEGVTMTSGTWVVDKDITFTEFLRVSGDVKLILGNGHYGTTLTAKDGIYVPAGSSLTIYGYDSESGSLVANPGENGNTGPGIGGMKGAKGGDITIHSGSVTAVAGKWGAGIGGGKGSDSGYGNITIYGGTVTATGGSYGAGIGSGDDNSSSNLGTITVYGGTVQAEGGQDAAGIGGGDSCSGGTINIWGGTVKGYGGDKGAGIGGGDQGKGGSIYIHGGTVKGEGSSEGAGIGGGKGGRSGYIEINGGSVTGFSWWEGAGIGGGSKANSETIVINGGKVTAYTGSGQDGGAGIGGGKDACLDGTVTITGGEVYATGSGEAAGIGGGSDKDLDGEVKITGGYVRATGGDQGGAGIGAGWAGNLDGKVTISGGTVVAKGDGGGAGIGGGCESFWTNDGGKLNGTVNITGGTVTAIKTTENARAIGSGADDGTNGTLTIYDTASVKAGASESSAAFVNYDKRVSSCRDKDNYWVKITTCEHGGETYYTDKNFDAHEVRCKYCSAILDEEAHTWGDDDKCTKCGRQAYSATFDYNNGTGEKKVFYYESLPQDVYMIKAPSATPGKAFKAWVADDSSQSSFPADTTQYMTITKSTTFTAKWVSVYTVTIDPNNGIDKPYTIVPTMDYDSNGTPVSATFEAPAAPTAQEGQTFKNWKIEGSLYEGQDEYVDAEDTAAIAGDVTVTAQWAGNPVITFIAVDIDGIMDKFEPLTFTGDGTTTYDATTKVGKMYADHESEIKAHFQAPEGYLFDDDHPGIPKLLSEYSKWTDIPQIKTTNGTWYNTELGEGNRTIYVPMLRKIEDAELAIAVPDCGDTSTTPTWAPYSTYYFDYDEQINKPSVTANDDLFTVGPTYWKIKDEATEEDYVLTFTGDNSYKAYLELQPNVGYAFDEEATTFDITGGEMVDGTWADEYNNHLISFDISVDVEHEWGEWETTKEATCQEEGTEERECSRCGETETREISINPSAHVWGDAQYEWNDDNTQVRGYYECDICGVKESETVAATSEVTKAATCEENGETTYTSAAFTNEAFSVQTKTEEDIDALGHDWGEWEVTKEPTEEEEGVKTRTCRNDSSHVDTASIPKKDHVHVAGDAVHEHEVAASCTKEGSYDEVIYCTGCDQELSSEHKTIAALGHDWSAWEEKTDDYGRYNYRQCSRCGEEQRIDMEDPECEHADRRTIEKLEPTCTEAGHEAYKQCEDCHVYIVTINGEEKIVTADDLTEYMAALTIPAKGHQAGDAVQENVVKATCEHAGSYDEVVCCSVCGLELSREHKTVDAMGHDWDEGVVTTQPTYDAEGVKTYTCEVCGATKTESIAKLQRPAPSGVVVASLKAIGQTSLAVSWTKMDNVDGYDIYCAPCNLNGNVYYYELAKTVSAVDTAKWNMQGLDKRRPYKFYVAAFVNENGAKKYVYTSPSVHAFTGGWSGKWSNAKKVTVKKSKVTLTKGKTSKIKAKIKLVKKGKKLISSKHAKKFRYISSDTGVATVTAKGTIKAVGSGSCVVYVLSPSGAYKAVKVTVK